MNLKSAKAKPPGSCGHTITRPAAEIRMRIVTWMLFAVLAGPALVSADDTPAETMTILDSGRGHWRSFCVWRTPVPVLDSGNIRPMKRRRHFWMSAEDPSGADMPTVHSGLPPADWAGIGFDDSDWLDGRGPFGRGYHAKLTFWDTGSAGQTHRVLVRGRFAVTDASAVAGLTLSLAYQGGVVVYVNGREVARGHVPAGKVNYDTLAEPYPDDTYVGPDGKQIEGVPGRGTTDEQRARYEKRVRRLTVDVPASALRKGVNVLAIATLRAPVGAAWANPEPTRYKGDTFTGWPNPWAHCRLLDAKLSAASGEGLVPNVARPAGAQVWTAPATARKTWLNADAWGDPNEPGRPIRIIACRNGTFCGKAVIASRRPIANLSAELSNLRGNGHVIPASAAAVLFARPDDFYGQGEAAFSTLLAEAPATVPMDEPAGEAIQPVGIKLAVPVDAGAGQYAGTLTLRWDGHEPWTVPVRVSVADFRLPGPKQFRTFIDLIQSPETLAIHYKVPQWSDAHFGHIARSLELFGQAGNKTTYLKLITRTHFGNTQSIVRLERDGDGWRRDYSLLERYMDLVEKHQGKPEVVVLYCWERYTAGGQPQPPRMTAVDPKTGELTEVEAPAYGTPEGETFWAEVFKELRERFAKRGLAEALALGVFGDFNGLRKENVAFFSKVAPGMAWVSQGHGLTRNVFGTPVRYATTVWSADPPQDPTEGRAYGWRAKADELDVCHFPRGLWRETRLAPYRTLLEWNVAAGRRGAGRIGGDFWEVKALGQDDTPSRGGRLTLRFPEMGKWGQLAVRQAVVGPGPKGAAPSVVFEALREGIQDCEARAFIEKALLGGKLPGDLADRARDALDQRTRFLIGYGPYAMGYQERQQKLYALAAEVAAALRDE